MTKHKQTMAIPSLYALKRGWPPGKGVGREGLSGKNVVTVHDKCDPEALLA